MPTNIEQNKNGKWELSLHHTSSSDVAMPVTLYYKGKDPVEVTITKDTQRVVTPWKTPLGTKLDEKEITVESSALFEADGSKRYFVENVTWNMNVYTANITHDLIISPASYTTPTNEGSTGYKAYYLTLADNEETDRINVTDVATWSVVNTNIADVVGKSSEIAYYNSGTTLTSTTVKATYQGENASATIRVKGYVPPTPYTYTAYGELTQKDS